MITKLLRMLRGLLMRIMPMMTNCREVEKFIDDYLDEALPLAQRRVFELHLSLCRECRAYLKRYQTAIALGRSAFDDADQTLPDDMPEYLIKAIMDAREVP